MIPFLFALISFFWWDEVVLSPIYPLICMDVLDGTCAYSLYSPMEVAIFENKSFVPPK